MRYRLLLMLTLGRHVAPDQLVTAIEHHHAVHARRLAEYEDEFQGTEDRYAAATLSFGIHYERAVLSWFDGLPDGVTAGGTPREEVRGAVGSRGASGQCQDHGVGGMVGPEIGHASAPHPLSRRPLTLNVTALVDITRAFIDRLSRAEGGYLVNIASGAAYQPIPGMAVYAASKAFVLNLTEALWWETRGSGLRTMAFSPGLTRSEFFGEIGTQGYGSGFQTPDEVARALVRALDRDRSVPSTAARASTAVAVVLVRLFSRKATVLVAARGAGSAGLMSKRRPVGT